MLRIPHPWIVLIVLVVALVAFWDKSPQDLLGDSREKSSNFPHAYMTDIEMREYGTDGKLRNILTTDAAEHYQVNPNQPGTEDYTLIQKPYLIFSSSATNAPWIITAEQGRIDQNGQRVTLITAVNASQQSPEQGLIELLTSELHIKTSEQYAETDKAVKMRAQQGHLDTVGLKAFLSEDRIELLSQVRGTYEPR